MKTKCPKMTKIGGKISDSKDVKKRCKEGVKVQIKLRLETGTGTDGTCCTQNEY